MPPRYSRMLQPRSKTDSSDLDNRQYLAISTLPHIDTAPAAGEKWPRDSQGSIQIWSIPHDARSTPEEEAGGGGGAAAAAVSQNQDGMEVDDEGHEAEAGAGADEGERAKCEMVLCVQGGPVMGCRWMPMGAWDDVCRVLLHSSQMEMHRCSCSSDKLTTRSVILRGTVGCPRWAF
jgi:transcription factor C subunit 6